MQENFENAVMEFDKANLDFQQKLILLQEIQAQYTNEVQIHGNTGRARDLYSFIYKLIDKLKKDVKLEKGFLDLMR